MQTIAIRDVVQAQSPGVEEMLAERTADLRPAFADALVSVGRIMDSLPPMEDFATREQAVLAILNEVGRQFLGADLQRTADSFGDEVVVNGKHFRLHEPGTRRYNSLCGGLEVSRATYRMIGVHNGPTIVPFELATGMVLGATPALAYSVADGVAEVDTRKYEEMMRAAGRCPPSRSTISRLANGVGGAIKQDVELFEPMIRLCEDVPDGAHAIAVGLDRTTTPMAEEIPPETATKPKRKKPYIREEPPPITVNYRMAYVGTVSVVNSDGEALRTWRFGATAEEGSEEIVRRMMAEVSHLRRQARMSVTIVQDGAPELWGLIWNGLRSIGISTWHNVRDRFHVMERMNAALEAARIPTHGQFRTRYIERLESSDHVVRAFCVAVEKACRSRPLSRELFQHLDYLRMADLCGHTRYATARRLGLPTGSGVTEGACKSLIAKRFKGSGQRWKQDGLTAILTLRALRQSARLRPLWSLFRNRYRALVECP